MGAGWLADKAQRLDGLNGSDFVQTVHRQICCFSISISPHHEPQIYTRLLVHPADDQDDSAVVL